MEPRTLTLLLNDRCPLRCAHCSAGFSTQDRGSNQVMDKETMRRILMSLDPKRYQMVVLAGGEPALVPDLVSAAVDACREAGIWSALSTGPYWANTLATARRFLASISQPDFLILSFDKYHLDFISIDHYINAVTAALELNIHAAVNICYTSAEDRETTYKKTLPFRDKLTGIHFARVMPLKNATHLDSTLAEGVTLDKIEDLKMVPRSCKIGNGQLKRDFEFHACCWSGQIPSSPLMFSRNAARHPGEIGSMDESRIFRRIHGTGIIDVLSNKGQAKLLKLFHGRRFVNECHLCITMLQERVWLDWMELEPYAEPLEGMPAGVAHEVETR